MRRRRATEETTVDTCAIVYRLNCYDSGSAGNGMLLTCGGLVDDLEARAFVQATPYVRFWVPLTDADLISGRAVRFAILAGKIARISVLAAYFERVVDRKLIAFASNLVENCLPPERTVVGANWHALGMMPDWQTLGAKTEERVEALHALGYERRRD